MFPLNKKAAVTALICCAIIVVVLIFATVLFSANVPLLQAIQNLDLQYHPLGSAPQSEAFTGVLYLIPTIGFTFLLVVGLRRKPRLWIKVAVGSAFVLSTSLIMFIAYFSWLDFYPSIILVTALGVPFLVAFRTKSRSLASVFSSPFKVWLSVGIAFLLITILPFWTVLALCIFAACWDVYAVFRGPLRAIADTVKSNNSTSSFLASTMMLDFGLGAIGLGDITFYSLLIMLALSLDTQAYIVAYIAILLGVFVSYYILKSGSRKALPGLPLPVLFFMIAVGVYTLV